MIPDAAACFAGGKAVLVEEGDWATWRQMRGDPFMDLVGPFFYRAHDDGGVICAMRVEARHLNGGGALHGGAMMTFADFALFAFAERIAGSNVVTLSLAGDYMAPVPIGSRIECRGEVIKRTRTLIFVRGTVRVGTEPVFAFTGLLKIKRGDTPSPPAA